MEFYQAISQQYDAIFPVGEAQLDLLQQEFAGKTKVLDLACGTGGYALALGGAGFEVVGLDLDASMIEEAKLKARGDVGQVEFFTADMQNCGKMFSPNSFGGIFCIGNSLVHLPNKGAVAALIKNVYSLLQKDGVFITQIVNYDRVLHYNVTELPTINNEAAGVKFIRKYSYNSKEQAIIFSGTLERVGQEPITNAVSLLPLLQEELEGFHLDAGFARVETYGDFKRSPFNVESQALVMIATK